jgi:WD40 repeat protein
VTAVCCTSKVIASGGADGSVRYWDARSRQMLTQFTVRTAPRLSSLAHRMYTSPDTI